MHSVTDRQTDGQTDNRLMPIADHFVAVRSAKNETKEMCRTTDFSLHSSNTLNNTGI